MRHVARIAWKDLRIELRSREIVYTMVFFGALLVVIYSFAFPKDARAVRGSVPGMLWVAIAFTGTIGLGRAFGEDIEAREVTGHRRAKLRVGSRGVKAGRMQKSE